MTDYDRTVKKQASEITLLQHELLAKAAEIEMLKSQLEKAQTQLEKVFVIDSEHSISKMPPPDIEVLVLRIKRAVRPFFSENICSIISMIVDNEKANM